MKNLSLLIFLLQLFSCQYLEKNKPNKDIIKTDSDIKRQTCILIKDVESNEVVYKSDRGLCSERIYAASTFKIPLALMAFHRNVLESTTTELSWDKTPQFIKAWERSHTAKSWFKDSVVWYSQKITPKLGEKRIINFLKYFNYGNFDFSGGLTQAWLSSSLKISPEEQVNFLSRVRAYDYNLKNDAIDKVLSILPVGLDNGDYKIIGKTGSGQSFKDVNADIKKPYRIGWYVGYIEKNNRVYSFAVALKDKAIIDEFVNSGAEAKELALKTFSQISFSNHQQVLFDKNKWLVDFEQLKKIISETYPNLEAKLEFDKINFYKLNKFYLKKFNNIKSNLDGKVLLKKFVAEFKDGHFNLQAISKEAKATTSKALDHQTKMTSQSTANEVCQIFAPEKSKRISFSFPLSMQLGYLELSRKDDYFQIAELNLSSKKIGLIRMPSFHPEDFPDFCLDEWKNYQKTFTGMCDQTCQDKFQHEILNQRIVNEFLNSLKSIKSRGISALVLDITNNGGGTESVAGVMRLLTQKPIQCGKFGMIKHPHWVKQLTKEKIELEKKLKQADIIETRNELKLKLVQNNFELTEVQKKCDRSNLWHSEKYRPNCSLMVKEKSSDCVSTSFSFPQSEAYSGPLYVLVNNSTASASEDLVARFKDSKIATIVGEKTYGAGCGYTNGGINLILKNSEFKVNIPDCARYLKDGSNEVSGISPHDFLKMDDLESAEFSARLKDYLAINKK